MNNISQEIEGIYTSNSRNGTYFFVILVHIKTVSFLDSGTVHNAPFHMKTEQNFSVLALCSHCSETFENASQKRRHLKTLHIPLLIGCWLQ